MALNETNKKKKEEVVEEAATSSNDLKEEVLQEEVEENESEIKDINLSAIRKQRFRIDGDNNRILELDISDMNIIRRLNEVGPKLESLAENAAELLAGSDPSGKSDDEIIESTAKLLEKVDTDMRSLVDEIFDSNVSELCAPSGNMYDPFGGKFRYEHIIETVSSLYEENLSKQFKKIANNISKHTNKYTKKNR